MQQVPLDLKVTPTSLDEIDQWRSELLWHPMNKDDIVEYIRANIKSHKEVKSGVVLYRDFVTNTFQQISFSQRSILQPEEAQAIVKLKKPEPAKRPYTFEEKTELLKVFISQNGRIPDEKDKFTEGPNLFTFYKSLIRGQSKYGTIIDDCKSNTRDDAPAEATVPRRVDGSDDVRGGGRILGRGRRDDGADPDSKDEVPVEQEEEQEQEPEHVPEKPKTRKQK